MSYKVDLTAHITDCELNYQYLLKLMPDMAAMDGRELGMATAVLQLAVRERAPYTTVLDLRLSGLTSSALPPLRLQVRVCHDAAVAEVVACQGARRVRPRYDYPNRDMFQRDEKRQWNRLLGDWLRHCLDHGYSLDHPVQLLEL